MKKKYFLFSLLAVFLFSCQEEKDEFLSPEDQTIELLEQKYGVKFKEVTEEIDMSNAIIIPIDELKQLLESATLSTRAFGMPVSGRGIYKYGILTFTFDQVPLKSYYLKVDFTFQVGDKGSRINIMNSLFCDWSYLRLIDPRNGDEIAHAEIQYKTMGTQLEFKGKADVTFITSIGGKWRSLEGWLDLSLRPMKEYAESFYSFKTLLTLSYTF